MKNDGTVFTLENEELLITVDRHGAELTGSGSGLETGRGGGRTDLF